MRAIAKLRSSRVQVKQHLRRTTDGRLVLVREHQRAADTSSGFSYNGVHWPNVQQFVAFGHAVAALHDNVAWWVYRGTQKKQLFDGWRSLSAEQREALDTANAAAHGTKPVTLYRLRTGYEFEGELGGASFTDDPELWGDKSEPYTVNPRDIMVSHRTPDLGQVFNNRTYGHEREVILKPDAKPTKV